MFNIFSFKATTIFLGIVLSTTTSSAGEGPIAIDFDPFDSNQVGVLSESQTIIDQSPLIAGVAFTNTDISDVFQILRDKTKWSIFPTAEVSRAKISLYAHDITAKNLLETVVTMAGFIYHQDADIITVMTYDEYMQFYGLAKKVVHLKHGNCESISMVIKPFLSKLGKSVVHAQTNTIVIFETNASLETIVGIVEELDTPAEVKMVIKVVDLNYMDAVVLADTLQKVFLDEETKGESRIIQKQEAPSQNSSERITKPDTPNEEALSTPRSRVGVYSIDRTNQLIVKASQSDIEEVEKLVERLDTYVEPTTKIYHFIYVDAKEIFNGLERILDIPTRSGTYGRSDGQRRREGGRPGGITLIEKTNSILLTGPPSVHRVMTSIAESIDVAVTYEAGIIRIYKLENADIDEVAAAIRELLQKEDKQEQKPGEPKFTKELSESRSQTPNLELTETEEFIPQIEARVAVSKSTNSVIIQATARQHRELENLIKELDKRRKQVFIKAVIVEVTTNDDMDLGIELDYFEGDLLAFTSFGLSTINPATGVRNIIVSPGGTAAVLQPNRVQAIFKALQGKDNVRIESAPQVLVNDNAVGTIQSIAEQPTRQTNQGETTTTTSFGEYVTAGTQFFVTPHISESDYLRVEYQIVLNSFGEQADPELPPTRSTSTIQSEATVPDGSTIVVGGIQSSSESESVDKVPLLGDIPLLGLVFQNTIIRKQYITTYLFITPTIMKSEDFADLEDVSQKAMEKVKKEDGTNQTHDTETKDIK
jgi:type II secretion system protein D